MFICTAMKDFCFKEVGKVEISIWLYETDGGVWKLEAIQNIKEYLKATLDGLDIDIFA